MEADELLTAQQAAERLGIDRKTVTRWVHAGSLRAATKLPGRTGAYLFRRADVEAAASGEQPASSDSDEHHRAQPIPV